jgi:hypothetical protein
MKWNASVMVSSPVNNVAEPYFRHALNKSTLRGKMSFVLAQCLNKEQK